MRTIKLTWVLILSIIFITSCASSEVSDGSTNSSIVESHSATVISTDSPTVTPEPTKTEVPTSVPTSTPPPTPTSTPIPTETPVDEESLIRQSFEEYREALLEGDSEAAILVVDQKSIDWYGDVLEYALALEREEVARLDFVEKFTLLRLRHEFSKEELEGFTGEDVLKIGIDNGWISKSSVEAMELVDIQVDNLRGFYIFHGRNGTNLFVCKRRWSMEVYALENYCLGKPCV